MIIENRQNTLMHARVGLHTMALHRLVTAHRKQPRRGELATFAPCAREPGDDIWKIYIHIYMQNLCAHISSWLTFYIETYKCIGTACSI
jgi:hypothetical protein